MPYALSRRKKDGAEKFCMTSKDTGKTYCYSSAEARKKGMQQHEMFKHMKAEGIKLKKINLWHEEKIIKSI